MRRVEVTRRSGAGPVPRIQRVPLYTAATTALRAGALRAQLDATTVTPHRSGKRTAPSFALATTPRIPATRPARSSSIHITTFRAYRPARSG